MRTLMLPIALSLFAVLPAKAQVQMTRIPIEYEGVTVSVEMPKKWADSEFGYRSVPADVKERMGRSGQFVICEKTIVAKRSFFRGELGLSIIDISIVTPALNSGGWAKETERTRAYEAKLRECDFRKPKDLFELQEIGFLQLETERKYSISYAQKPGGVWIRVREEDGQLDGVPRLEMWFIGVAEDSYVRFDLSVIRKYSGSQGEAWQKSALYWQNKMIESLTVTGLEQDLTGVENVETWRFPDALEYAPELIK